ncbi:hypothetical protein NFJ02_01g35960 [Pycnococcus provasolii]
MKKEARTMLNFRTINLGTYKLRHNSHGVEDLLQTKLANTSCRTVGMHKHRVLGHQLQNASIDLSSYVKYNSTHSILDEKTVLALLTGGPRPRMRDNDGFVGSVALANMVPLARKDTVNMNSYMELLDTVAPTFRTRTMGWTW